MPHVATSPADLLATLASSAHLDGDRLVIHDATAFRDTGTRDLAWTAAFSTDEATTSAAQWLVWEASQALGARSASIQDLYDARARGEVSGFTVPAINLRAQVFDMARTVYEAASAADVGIPAAGTRVASSPRWPPSQRTSGASGRARSDRATARAG